MVPKLAMGELETAVMDVVWRCDAPVTPGDVRTLLAGQRPLAYTTVMTILVRLWRKGRLERERVGRAYAYRPVDSQEEYAAARMGEVLGGVPDRPKALGHFVHVLDPVDRAQLERMLGIKRN